VVLGSEPVNKNQQSKPLAAVPLSDMSGEAAAVNKQEQNEQQSASTAEQQCRTGRGMEVHACHAMCTG
jgi:hypothetical protein